MLYLFYLQAQTTQATAPDSLTQPTGQKTSEHYRTFNIPERFENPGKYM